MFYDHLSAHSIFTLGQTGSMRTIIDDEEVGLKENPEDIEEITSK